MSLPSLSKVIADDAKYTEQLSERELQAESSLISGDKPEGSLNVSRGAIRAPSPDPSLTSIEDSNDIRLDRSLDYLPVQNSRRQASCSPARTPRRTFHGRLQSFWITNKGLALVLISQLFGTLMNVTTRMLEMEGNDGG